MRPMFVAGNWKMNTLLQPAMALAGNVATEVPASSSVEVMVAPPFPYLQSVGERLQGSGVVLGAQNAWFEEPGAFTGEVAIEMLKDVGCRYVILGHSERRHVIGEDDALINKKVAAALRKGLPVILCVGETLGEREANRTEQVLDTQMSAGLSGVDAEALRDVVIAYEPVWAIGTGRTATAEQAESSHAYLRNWLRDRYNSGRAEQVRLLYGGSVKPDNAAPLLSQPNVDGALVGGASLKADQFLGIVRAAERAAS